MFALLAELCLAQDQTQTAPDSPPAQDQPAPTTEQPPQGQPSSTPDTQEPAKQPQAAPQPKPTPPAVPSNQPSVQLDTSETLFAVLAAMNVCGYDEELGFSDPLREQIRGEVSQAIQQSEEAKETATAMCQFYEQHRQPDSSKTLAQYVSLALYLNAPPALTPKVKEADLPPDAARLTGVPPLIQRFYEKAGLHDIWQRHRQALLGSDGALSRTAVEDGI